MRYDSTRRPRRVLTPEIRGLIEDYLDKNERKRATGRSKQCMRAIDIHEQLADRGYEAMYLRSRAQAGGGGLLRGPQAEAREDTLHLRDAFLRVPARVRPAAAILEKEERVRAENRRRQRIREAREQKNLLRLEARFMNYDLVICDEFGYVSCDKEAGELLFNHLSMRAGRKATLITTNLAFNRWDEIVRDKVLATALVDRLTHKAYLVNMNGDSYRLKETQKLLMQNERQTAHIIGKTKSRNSKNEIVK